jgi:hypothetical protein
MLARASRAVAIRYALSVAIVLTMAAGLIVTSRPAAAMHGTISGTVTDTTTGLPLENVCVTVGPPIRCWTATNSVGRYLVDLTNIGPDGQTWDLYFLRAGYDTQKQTLVLNGPTVLDVGLVRTAGTTPPATVPPPANLVQQPPPSPAFTVYLPNITRMLGGRYGWHTPFIVQNVGSSSTSLDVRYYRFSDGSLVATRTATVLPGRSFVGSPNDEADLPADTQFSVVARSTGAPIVAVVNEHQGQGAAAEALSYSGFGAGSTTVFLPLVAKMAGGWLTTMIMQNLGTVPTTVTASFKSLDGLLTASVVRTVTPGRSQFIDPRSEPALQDGVEYAATLTASEPIAVVANAHNDLPGTVMPMGDSYNGVPSVTGTTTYAPYVAKNTDAVGRSSRIVVQNAGSAAATPALTLQPFAGGTATSVTGPSIAPGASWAVVPATADGEFALTVTQGAFAVLVTTTSPATAMYYTGTSGPAGKLFLPNVTRSLSLGFPDPGWTTPILIESATATSATLRWYRFSDGSLVTTQDVTLTAGGTTRIDPRSVPALADNSQYAVVLESAGRVVVIVTELDLVGGDNAMIYKGFAE